MSTLRLQYMLTQRKPAAHAPTGSRRHRRLQRREVGALFWGDSVHTWPQINLGSLSELIVYQPADTHTHTHNTHNTHRPRDEPHIGAISCTSTVPVETSAPWTDAFKDNGWLLHAPESSLVKITETWSEIDSLEELQIDTMWLIIAYSTRGYFGFRWGKKYPRRPFSFTRTWKLILMHTHKERLCVSLHTPAVCRGCVTDFPAKYDYESRKENLNNGCQSRQTNVSITERWVAASQPDRHTHSCVNSPLVVVETPSDLVKSMLA